MNFVIFQERLSFKNIFLKLVFSSLRYRPSRCSRR